MRVKKNLMKYRNPSTGQFEPIPVLVSESANGKYELIESFEVTEEIIEFVRTAEPDGTPYDFQKIKVIVKKPPVEKNGFAGIVCIDDIRNLAYISSNTQAFNINYCTVSQYNAKIDNGVLVGDATTVATSETNIDNIDMYITKTGGYLPGAVCRTLFDISESVRMDKIEYLRYGSLNSYPIPVGTKIDIYAVR